MYCLQVHHLITDALFLAWWLNGGVPSVASVLRCTVTNTCQRAFTGWAGFHIIGLCASSLHIWGDSESSSSQPLFSNLSVPKFSLAKTSREKKLPRPPLSWSFLGLPLEANAYFISVRQGEMYPQINPRKGRENHQTGLVYSAGIGSWLVLCRLHVSEAGWVGGVLAS